jgi:hypothetical protein
MCFGIAQSPFSISNDITLEFGYVGAERRDSFILVS